MNDKNALKQCIQATRDTRELKRALAVQNTEDGRAWAVGANELGVSRDCMGKWRRCYHHQGVNGLRLGYQGSKGYLSPDAQHAILTWLSQQSSWIVGALQRELAQPHGVRYRSKQRYDALLTAARLSWKNTQQTNPPADPQQVQAKRAEIQNKSRRRFLRLS